MINLKELINSTNVTKKTTCGKNIVFITIWLKVILCFSYSFWLHYSLTTLMYNDLIASLEIER